MSSNNFSLRNLFLLIICNLTFINASKTLSQLNIPVAVRTSHFQFRNKLYFRDNKNAMKHVYMDTVVSILLRKDNDSTRLIQQDFRLYHKIQCMKIYSILTSCVFQVIGRKLDLLRFSEVAKKRLFLDPFQRFIASGP